MAVFELSPAKAVLLAVQLAITYDISTLRSLIFQHRKILRTDLVLRILLSHLPETVPSAKYVPFLQDLVDGSIDQDPDLTLEPAVVAALSEIKEMGEKDASRRVRKLHLLQLLWPSAPAKAPGDHLVLFLIHRAIRVDQYSGLLSQLPALLRPFLQRSAFLRTWMITTVLPLLRLSYQYHPRESPTISIPEFEAMNDEAGLSFLLSSTGKEDSVESKEVGRDLRGLVGPWMYGDIRSKRRKLRKHSSTLQTIDPLDEAPRVNEQCVSWEEVFKWITNQASVSWRVAVLAIEQWDGPRDVDLGDCEDATEWLSENDKKHLERRYSRSALSAAYIIPEASLETLAGVQQILARILTLLDLDRIPTLDAAAALLTPVPDLGNLLSQENKAFIRYDHLEESNVLTMPNEISLRLLHALLISAYIFSKAGNAMNVKRAAELAISQQENEQRSELKALIALYSNRGTRTDDRYWMKIRNEILWLRSWGAEELQEGAETGPGRGILGRLPKEEIEFTILKTLLSNNRIVLAQSIYQNSREKRLPNQILHDTLIMAAKDAFDNATNGNRTRGGVKRSSDILSAFPDILKDSLDAQQMSHLIKVADKISTYSLIVKKQEGFRPVYLRVHDDPISIISKILQQNPRSYLQINDMVSMGRELVKAGLTKLHGCDRTAMTKEDEDEEYSNAEKRIISFCIDAALSEDDFETAYSYVTTRLTEVAEPAQACTDEVNRSQSGIIIEKPPIILDDWSWKAALEAGKHKFHHTNASLSRNETAARNAEIRHLEQRKECLSHALRYAPPSALSSILSAFRRCEEELDTKLKEEEEAEAAFDAQVDKHTLSGMPGGFDDSPPKYSRDKEPRNSRPAEESPMSLLDLSRASMASAQIGISTLSLLRGGQKPQPKPRPVSQGSIEGTGASTPESVEHRERKRDQLRNVAAGTLNAGAGALAGGLSWVLGAQPTNQDQSG